MERCGDVSFCFLIELAHVVMSKEDHPFNNLFGKREIEGVRDPCSLKIRSEIMKWMVYGPEMAV